MPRKAARPTTAVGQLLLAGKLRADVPWKQLEQQLGVRKATREFWVSGRVKRLPLHDVVKLAKLLDITGTELDEAVLNDRVPAWALHELKTFYDGAGP